MSALLPPRGGARRTLPNGEAAPAGPDGRRPRVGRSQPAVPRDRADLRIAPPAVAAWAAAALVAGGRPGRAAGLALGAAGLLLVLGAAGTALARRRRRDDRAAPVVALLLAAVGAVLAGGGAQAAARDGWLADLVADGAVVTLTGTVREGGALPASWPGAQGRMRWVVAAEAAVARGRSGAVLGEVEVLAPAGAPQGHGGDGAPLGAGARVQVVGRLSEATRPGRPARLTAARPPQVLRAPPGPLRVAGRVRDAVDALADELPGDAGALLPGVTVGDTSRVPEDLQAAMRTAGLTHLVAVSGAHFSLVAALASVGVAALGLPRALRAGAVVLSMAAMVLVVQPSSSVVRAAVMGTVGALGTAAGRRARAPAALAAAVLVLLVHDVGLATDLGFVLSVVATAALVLAGEPLTQRWSGRLGRPAAAALAVPVAAQVACAPVVLALSPTLATYGVPANVLAAPAVAPATVLGLAAGVAGTVWPAAGEALATLAGAACWWIARVARVCAALPGAQLAWLPGPAGALLLALVGAAVLGTALARSGPRPPDGAQGRPAGVG